MPFCWGILLEHLKHYKKPALSLLFDDEIVQVGQTKTNFCVLYQIFGTINTICCHLYI
jgi:hypothetical protein